jgi:hypothetical protein
MAKFTQDASSFPANIRSNSSVQECALGTKVVTPDGRAFRYVKAGGTALVAGKLYDGPAEIANHQNLSVASAAAAGASSITVTLGATAATADQYAGGVIVINDVDGQGFTYSIKSHPAADASASLTLTLDDEETVVTALTTSSQATLVPNQYKNIIIHASTETGVPVGVAVTQITASYYGWIQTRGPVAVLQDVSAADIGMSVAASATTDGAVTANDGTLKEVGTMLATGVSTEYNPVFLSID